MAEAEANMRPVGTETIHDRSDSVFDNSDEFNPWDLFLSDEEILKINLSGGLIGLNMDEKRMMGNKTLQETKKAARFKTPKAKRAIWIKPMINEILHIARHLKDNNIDPGKIWDNICIGSDYNGMITPLKAFKTATKFPEMNETLFTELKKLVPAEPLLSGKTDNEIQEITDKIMWKNNLAFLEKHFHF
jgi:microsomal dipeptidase-like Zn-dependent dipeptidase